MFRRPIFWCVVSILCFVGAAYFWHLGDQWEASKPRKPGTTSNAPATTHSAIHKQPSQPIRLLSQAGALNFLGSAATTNASRASATNRFAYRLTNTTKTPGELAGIDSAILLENAMLDTAQPLNLDIPSYLKSEGEPGAYIVQAKAATTDAFRRRLQSSGGEIISYIPNNAYLVRGSSAVAQQLAGDALVQSVLPYEPYYKLKSSLLNVAVEGKSLPENTSLNLLLFDGNREATLARLEQMGVQVVNEQRTPFGQMVRINPSGAGLQALAGLPGVQQLDIAHARAHANDLTRPRIGVATDSITPNTYLNLTGSNILVNINDSGVDTNHPDLQGRVTVDRAASGFDTSGHGTHIAGIIAGNGSMSLTVSNAEGSINPPSAGQFRGMAPGAKLLALSTDNGFGASDEYLQETAAQTNALISNNSWTYLDASYDLAAASYDAAVRDALPGVTGSQPLVYVFAAGNSGLGSDNGTDGQADSILSPATAKNVITVGTIEQARGITNLVTKCTTASNGTNSTTTCTTNEPWAAMTDSRDQVAGFSGRGNVGIGTEGDFGRFKPDVVTPGTFVISTRSTTWDQKAYYNPTSDLFEVFLGVSLTATQTFFDTFFLPDNAVSFSIRTPPDPGVLIYVNPNDVAGPGPGNSVAFATNNLFVPPPSPLSPKGQDWFYTLVNPSSNSILFDLVRDIVVTNELGNYLTVLSNKNEALGPFYRYESGTSMSAGSVSGTLALMEEFFIRFLNRTNSPALMKALLINGARSAGVLYDFQVQTAFNSQGWGVVNLPNSIPGALTNVAASSFPMTYVDQNPTNALATGDRRTKKITVSAAGRNQALRATLVWTDPPGNPVAGVKLVNDLDLIITNLDTGDVYLGNDILNGNDFNQPWDTNFVQEVDRINNVENIYLGPPLGTNFSVTVSGHRVNVNAVTAHTNGVVQDYALVISSGDGAVSDALTIQDTPNLSTNMAFITYLTNQFASNPDNSGSILINETVGANSPLIGTNTIAAPSFNGAITIGVTNQWHFYVVSNFSGFTNAAFVTFIPVNLSLPRMGVFASGIRSDHSSDSTRPDADIDLYVSTDPDLTNLAPNVVAAATKSLNRGGTEAIVLTNADPSGIYYVGVKSEDQEAAQYGFVGAFSLLPFNSSDAQGNQTITGIPSPAFIPDGNPSKPGIARIIGIGGVPVKAKRIIVTNVITHELMGDLLGNLQNDRHFAILNNHSPNSAVTNAHFVYDDSSQKDVPNSRPSDGPGSLKSFAGKTASPVWVLQEEDNAATHVGTDDKLTIFVEKQKDLEGGIDFILGAGACDDEFIDVPMEATNLTVTVSINSGTGPISMQVCPLNDDPGGCLTLSPISVIGGQIIIDKSSTPPLNAGTYVIHICNLDVANPVGVHLLAHVSLDAGGVVLNPFVSLNGRPIPDDAVSTSTIAVDQDIKIAAMEVGVRIDHPRISDLVLHLISPDGTRVLLQENRGGLSADGMGGNLSVTNITPVNSSGGPEANTNNIDTGATSGTITVSWDFFQIPDRMTVYYQGTNIFDTGMVSGSGSTNLAYGPGTSTFVTIIMNEGGNTNDQTAWTYTVTSTRANYQYVTYTENTNKTVTPMKFAVPPFTNANYIGTNVAFSNSIFYIPEQSLDAYTGMSAFGDWTLEIWDNRAGPFNTNSVPVLLGWDLAFAFATPTPTPIPLIHNGTVTNTVAPGQISYFSVDVPDWASFATNILVSATAPVNLLFDQSGPPPGTNGPGEFALLTGSVSGFNTLSTNGSPPLQPGFTYFLGVQNTNATAVTFSLQVDFDVTPLSNAVPVAGAIGPFQRYFSYDVSSNTTSVSFQLTNLSGNVDMVIRKGQPFPTLSSFTYGSFNPGKQDEIINVFTNSDPVPLTPGRYYIGVFDQDPTNVNYTIVVTESTNPVPTIITLFNRVPVSNTNSGTAPAIDYYRFVVSSNAVRAQFEVDNPTADVTLVARRGLPLPDNSSYDYRSANPGTNAELITIFNNSTPVKLTPGEWFISVVNNTAGAASYTITATEFNQYGTNIVIIGYVVQNNSLCLTWTSVPGINYYVEGKTNLNSTNWFVASPTIQATSSNTTYCIQFPTPLQYFRIVEGLAPAANAPVLPPTISSISVTPSGRLLSWSAPTNEQFNVQWTPTIAPPPPPWSSFTNVITSTNGNFNFLDDGTQTGGLGNPRYYRLLVLP